MIKRIRKAGITSVLLGALCISAIPVQAKMVEAYSVETNKFETAANANINLTTAIEKMTAENKAAAEAEKERLRLEIEARLETERIAAEEAAKAEQEAIEVSRQTAVQGTSNYDTGTNGVLTKSGGVNYFNGQKETYYSQRVLPGGGLDIPGRHVASDGTIRDEDGYIVVASDRQSKGEIGTCSLGNYKVYDTGVGHDGIDIYTDW